MTRSSLPAGILLALLASVLSAFPQSSPDVQTFFARDIGLSQDQIAAIRDGRPVTKVMPSRTPAEVFLFGAVYVHATPDKYVHFTQDFDRLRKLPNYLALGIFSNPPQASDLKGFAFDDDDIHALKDCKPKDCQIQLPASSIDEFHRSIDWSSADVNAQVNQFLQKKALERLLIYQHDGNQALGFYDDKNERVDVAQQFAYMLSYTKVLPARLPDFYQYLLAPPSAKPADLEDTFYWAKVKFGLKPTLRVVQTVTMRGAPDAQVACAVAEKQLYASHYFETALDLSFCVRGNGKDDPKQPGFYLIMAMGSEQAGLTGAKGSIVRRVAVGRSASNLQDALAKIKSSLENSQ